MVLSWAVQTEHADQLWSGDERRCHGARGFYFDYVVSSSGFCAAQDKGKDMRIAMMSAP